MNQVSTTTPPRRRGGRTADVTARIHQAALELVLEGGVEACTFTTVAHRAGIERSTLYRRYADRWDMMIDVWMARAETDVMPDLGDSFADDLASVLRKLRDTLESPLGRGLLSVAIELRASENGAYPRKYFDRRMSQLQPMFDAAISRGELSSDVDREALFTFAAGPIYFRMFIAGRPVDDDCIHEIVSRICWLYCSPSAAAKVSLPARIA